MIEDCAGLVQMARTHYERRVEVRMAEAKVGNADQPYQTLDRIKVGDLQIKRSGRIEFGPESSHVTNRFVVDGFYSVAPGGEASPVISAPPQWIAT